jgi:hypothetical protein
MRLHTKELLADASGDAPDFVEVGEVGVAEE